MPLPVIADVYRVTLNWATESQVTPHNVIHVETASANEADIAAAIEDNLTTNMIALLGDDQTLESIDVIKLDGTSAQQSFTVTSIVDGQGTGPSTPAAAGVLSIHTVQRGPRGRGRLFLGPLHDNHNGSGVIVPSTLPGAIVAAWTTFNDALTAADISMGVASYVHADFHLATGFSMRAAFGTMRRRQDQLVH